MASSTATTSYSTTQTVICVFGGASEGSTPAHMQAAHDLGEALAKSNAKLVYGGGRTGLMGEIARTLVALASPESVHGIIPRPLAPRELASKDCEDNKLYGRITVVEDLHTRKRMMASEVMKGGPGSGFIAMSGGWGTLDEIMEVVAWNQHSIHDRGTVLLSVDGLYTKLIEWANGDAVTAGFIKPENAKILVEAKTAEEAVLALKNYTLSAKRHGLDWGNFP